MIEPGMPNTRHGAYEVLIDPVAGGQQPVVSLAGECHALQLRVGREAVRDERREQEWRFSGTGGAMSAIAADSTSGVGCSAAPGTRNETGDRGDQVEPLACSSSLSRDTDSMSSSRGVLIMPPPS